MAAFTLDSALYNGLLGDAETARLLSDGAEIAAMIRVEKALAAVETRLGVIPAEAGAALVGALDRVVVDPGDLAEGLKRDGVILPALLVGLRKQMPAGVAPWLHYGATSQDVTDLALVLRLLDILDLFEARIADLIHALAALAGKYREVPCLARTRAQAAAPIVFGLKCATWLAPLVRHHRRITELRPRLGAVQFGGAAGTLAALGGRGIAVMDALADELGLARATPWHKGRDRIEEFASLMAMTAVSLGTLAADLVILAQSEIGEVGFDGAGGSSTLPQKQNPVTAEIVVSLARFAGMQAAAIHQAGIHVNERDGSAWALEWLALPPLISATGAALARSAEMLAALRPDSGRMRVNLEATRGLVLAEAAIFHLAASMPRAEAGRIVTEAIAATHAGGKPLIAEISARTGLDLAALDIPLAGTGEAAALIDHILAEAGEVIGGLKAG